MIQKPAYLIALDLDGTSVRYEPRLEMDPDLMQYIASLQSRGIAWVMNSDRYTDTMVDIAQMLSPDQMPAALLSCQRFIHIMNGERTYLPLHTWNKEQMLLHKELWEKISSHFKAWQKKIEQEFTPIECVVNDLVFACMAPPEQTPELRERIRGFIAPWPDAQVSGNHDWSFILHAAFSKGKVLGKCAELLGVPKGNIIAVGDGVNDITMLDGSVTPLVGCPANASREVIAAVRAAGGVVAEAASAAGTLHILKYYLADHA
jgi:HAD superfamily hydrolase (TIGR01484 family)